MNFTGQAADSDILYADLSTCARGLAEFLYDDLPEEQQPNVVDGISPTVGNSNANLANGGIAVDGEDGSIYYINFADNNRIYRWDAQHNTQTALTDGPCLYLNIFHGDLYYICLLYTSSNWWRRGRKSQRKRPACRWHGHSRWPYAQHSVPAAPTHALYLFW